VTALLLVGFLNGRYENIVIATEGTFQAMQHAFYCHSDINVTYKNVSM
jgi:hypothetical protein